MLSTHVEHNYNDKLGSCQWSLDRTMQASIDIFLFKDTLMLVDVLVYTTRIGAYKSQVYLVESTHLNHNV